MRFHLQLKNMLSISSNYYAHCNSVLESEKITKQKFIFHEICKCKANYYPQTQGQNNSKQYKVTDNN